MTYNLGYYTEADWVYYRPTNC